MENVRQIPGPLYWIGWFLIYFIAVVATFALIAMMGFVLVGAMTNPDLSIWSRAMQGLRNGAELGAKVWAFAISLVLCVMRAHRRHQSKTNQDSSHDV